VEVMVFLHASQDEVGNILDFVLFNQVAEVDANQDYFWRLEIIIGCTMVVPQDGAWCTTDLVT
jgi:hypothetical protein